MLLVPIAASAETLTFRCTLRPKWAKQPKVRTVVGDAETHAVRDGGLTWIDGQVRPDARGVAEQVMVRDDAISWGLAPGATGAAPTFRIDRRTGAYRYDNLIHGFGVGMRPLGRHQLRVLLMARIGW